MSQVRLISPRQDMIRVVADYLVPREGNDFFHSVVVFPGKRPAHFLRKHLAQQVGTSIIPPRTFSIDHLMEFILRDHLRIQSKFIDTVDAVALLHDVHLQLSQKLGGSAYTSLDAFLPLAFKLYGELEELALADIAPRRLSEAIRAVEFPKFHSLSQYYERFYQEVERRDLLTRSVMYRTVADGLAGLDLSVFDRIVLAGFYAFTNVEIKILSHLRSLGNTLFVFQKAPGLWSQLEKLNIEIDDDEEAETGESDTPALHFYRAPDVHGQMSALAAKLKERVDAGWQPDERSVIVLPSAEVLFPVLHGPLSLLDEDSFNISLGYPLLRTPLFGFLNSLMELIGGSIQQKFSTQAYLRFVLHPYTKNIRLGSRSDLTRIMFHRIEEYLVEHRAKLLLTLDELENDPALYDDLITAFEGIGEPISREVAQEHLRTIHNETIRCFRSFSSIGDFAARAIELLTFIFDHSTASLHPYFRPYAQRFVDILDTMRTSLLREKRFDTTNTYFTFFRQYIATEAVPFPGTPLKGLQVLGLLETRNVKFDTLYMLDANDDIVPPKPPEDLLLPQPVRLSLGLETNREREHLSRYYFHLAVESAREVHLFYTETETGAKEKSRFVQKLIWNKEREARRSLENELEQKIKYRVNLVNPKPDAIQKTPAAVEFLRLWNRFSASQLDTYVACPLRFYYRSVLRIREKAEASKDIDQREIGSLVHRVLNEFFAPFVGRPLASADLNPEDLDRVIKRCFAEEYGADPFGPAFFLRKQVSLQLRKLLDRYQMPIVQSSRVIITALEQEFNVEKNGVRFTGSVDRIETRDGRSFILDYKTGKDDASVRIRAARISLDDRESWRDAIGSFQLPVYMLLYCQANGRPPDEITPAYLFLGRSEISTAIEAGIGDDESPAAEVYQAVEPVIFKLISHIIDPSVPFEPTKHVEEECPRCPYTSICGTRWARGWRRD
ncbi:MAG: hypothetical protein FJ217_12965 [Ignavibacteria bacterium]|nr:hypothetical protein [Ignavibacteria bacterium]